MLRLTVLGSCGTYPGPARACSGYLIEAAAAGTGAAAPAGEATGTGAGEASGATGGARTLRVWVDTGSGSLANLLRHTTLEDLDAIWISHLHADHCSDLPLAYYTRRYGTGRRELPLPVYGPAGWEEHMGAFLNVTGATRDLPRNLDDVFEVHELTDGQVLDLGGLALTAFATVHSVPTYAVRATAGGVTIAYSADSGPCAALGRLAEGADLFVCEAALEHESDDPEPIHCTAADAGTWAARAGARKLLLTHLRPDADVGAATRNAKAAFDGPVQVALEGETYELGALH